MDIEAYKRELNMKYARKSAREEIAVEIFEDFMSKI
jgi:hypothetical protein